MNYIRAIVSQRQTCDNLNISSFIADEQVLNMISLELSNLEKGKEVILGVKPTNVALMKDFSGFISISNQLKVVITELIIGELLCSVKFDFAGEVQESIITKTSMEKMNLSVGDEIIALIKSSDISIQEVL